MTISSKNRIEGILRLFAGNIVSKKVASHKDTSAGREPFEGPAVISEEGRMRMRDRFQSDIINYLRTKY